MSLITGDKPDITPVQLGAAFAAVVTPVVGLAVAFGVDVSKAQQDAIVQFLTVGLPAVIVAALLADAWLRGKRNERAGMVEAAAVSPAPVVLAPAAVSNVAAPPPDLVSSPPDEGDAGPAGAVVPPSPPATPTRRRARKASP